jgi:aspartate aminotransferase
LFANPDWNHDYPSSHLGTEGFRRQSTALFFGEDDPLQERGW